MGPATLQLFANSECNLACWFCNTRQRRKETPHPPVSAEMVNLVLEAFPSIRKVWIGGTGEPLLHPQLPELLEAIHARGVRLHITTNGTKVLERQDLPWSLVETITVSLLEANEERYKQATGTKHFDTVIKGIEFLVGAVESVELARVVTRDTVEDMKAFLELAHDLGAHGVSFRNISRCAGDDLKPFIENTALHTGVEGLVDRMREVKAQAPAGLKIQWPRISDFSQPRGRLCWVLESMLVVDGAGNMGCCCRGAGARPEFGNVSQGPSAWRSTALEAFRQRVRGPEHGRPVECQCCYVPYAEVAL